jgi:hypothetical protein
MNPNFDAAQKTLLNAVHNDEAAEAAFWKQVILLE